MPIVQVEMIEGRTVEQKREMVKGITEVISKTLQVPTEAVTIIIRDMAKENFAKNGTLRCDQ